MQESQGVAERPTAPRGVGRDHNNDRFHERKFDRRHIAVEPVNGSPLDCDRPTIRIWGRAVSAT